MSELPALDLEPFPEVDLRHMLVLTDDTGMLQHATFATADLHHGYCTDDVARALIAAVMADALQPRDVSAEASPLNGGSRLLIPMQRYLAFLAHAFNTDTGRFRNFMGCDRRWLEEVGSQDSHARAVWGLGVAVRLAPNESIMGRAKQLLDQSLPALEGFKNVHPWAFGLLGIDEYLRANADSETAVRLRENLAERMLTVWQTHSTSDWPWWDDTLTWGNAKLPHALLVAGRGLEREDMVEAALVALRWLLEVQTAKEGHLSIIGNQGWFVRSGLRAQFDQQPIEAQGLVQACLAAAAATSERHWTDEAVRCFEWFLGRNDVGVPLYNPETGGCQDGLLPDGVNANQGAESTLAYLLSVLELHHYRRVRCGGAAASSARRDGGTKGHRDEGT